MSPLAQLSDPVKRQTVMLMREREHWYVQELAEQVRGGDEPATDTAAMFMAEELGDLIRAGIAERRHVEGPAQVGRGPRFDEAEGLL